MKPNYGFAKRQRELAKKQKKEEKKLRKLAGEPAQDSAAPVVEDAGEPAAPGPSQDS